MAPRSDHELIDLGDGRRLERFGRFVVDRPCPPAEWWQKRDPAAWRTADARFDRAVEGEVAHAGWTTRDGRPIEPWTMREGRLTAELRLAESGQVGWFPEQASNRAWIADRVRALATPGRRGDDAEAAAVLDLFGYTGGATVAAVAAGARATHVDGSRTAVAWGRRNAELNGLADRPVRWIADDAPTFARRERKRGRRYAGIVLDPPSYGHGAAGREWRLERDLPGLLADCAALLEPWRGSFVLLTAHTPDFGGDRLAAWLERAAGPADITILPLDLESAGGATLPLGNAIRWARRGP